MGRKHAFSLPARNDARSGLLTYIHYAKEQTMNTCLFRGFIKEFLLPHKLAIGGQQRADGAGAGVGGLAGDDDLAGAVVEGKDPDPELVDVGDGNLGFALEHDGEQLFVAGPFDPGVAGVSGV